MLSSVLRSQTAIEVNIGNNKELTCKDRIVYENIEYSHIKEKRDNT